VKEPLLSLAPSDLRALAAAIASGRLTPPFSTTSVERYVNAAAAQGITQSLQGLLAYGTSTQALGRVLELLAENSTTQVGGGNHPISAGRSMPAVSSAPGMMYG
jgi:hypothetical protein